MKKLLLLALALVMVMSVSAYGQVAGAIMLYADQAGTECEFVGNPAGLVTVFVFHSFTPGATASAFRIQHTGSNWVYIVDQPQAPTLAIGDTNLGGNWAYTQCFAGPHNFLNVLYSAAGAATVCAEAEVVAAPDKAFIEGVDCEDNLLQADGSKLVINPDGTCECGRIVPVQDTNWGQIKALYN
jgi:hypothetical protein